MTEQKRFCPLSMANDQDYVEMCQEKRCAWWIPGIDECTAFVAGLYSLVMATEIKEKKSGGDTAGGEDTEQEEQATDPA